MDVISRIKTLLLVLVQGIINIISCFVQKREKRLHIPRPNNGIVYTSATKLVERIRKKQISCEEIILAYIQRIEEINPVINAVVESRFAESIIEARKADEFLNSLSPFDIDILPHIKPLLGIPITVKESLGVKGLSFTGCSLTRNDIKAFEDADVIKLLKEAGAIILLVSNTSEYCSSIETSNKVIGRTRNPYDTRRSSGGSSGGEISYSPRKEFCKFLCKKSIFSFPLLLSHYFQAPNEISETKFQLYLKNLSEFKEHFLKSLGNNGIFLYPNFPTAAFKHNGSVSALTGTRFASIFNVLGCPTTCIPIGKSKNGLPLGIQIVAAPYQDNLCLEVGKRLEEYFGGWQPPYQSHNVI